MKIAVYSCMVGDNDHLPRFNKEEGIDYVLFTDQDIKSDFWDVRPLPPEAYIDTRDDPRRISRYVKINPMKVLSEYSHSIYLDATMMLKWSVMSYFVEMGTSVLAVRPHGCRKCAYEEARAVKFQGYDDRKSIDEAVAFLRSEGFPDLIGLCENGLLVRKHCKEIKELSDLWWKVYCEGSRRDQISLNYCLWKLKTDYRLIPRSSVTVLGHKRNNRVVV